MEYYATALVEEIGGVFRVLETNEPIGLGREIWFAIAKTKNKKV